MLNLKVPPQELNTGPHALGYRLKIRLLHSNRGLSANLPGPSPCHCSQIHAYGSTEASVCQNKLTVVFSLRIQDLAARKVKGTSTTKNAQQFLEELRSSVCPLFTIIPYLSHFGNTG